MKVRSGFTFILSLNFPHGDVMIRLTANRNDKGEQAMLSKIKANPFAYILWIMLSCVAHIALFRSKVNSDYQIWQKIVTLFIALCFTLPTHELLHFVFMKLFCKGSVKIKIMNSPLGLPTLGTAAQGEFQKWQLVIIYLAPLVLLTLLMDVIFLFCAKVELFFFIVSVCNSAGCFYDIVDAFIAANEKS